MKVKAALLAISLLFSFAADAKPKPKPTPSIIDGTESNFGSKNPVALEPYKVIFQLYSAKYDVFISYLDLTIRFVDISCVPDKKNECTIGYCHKNTDDTKVITLDRREWQAANYFDREQLIFHEFGHCLLNRAHKDTLDKTGRPLSLMHSLMIKTDQYQQYHDHYIEELFQTTDDAVDSGYGDHDVIDQKH